MTHTDSPQPSGLVVRAQRQAPQDEGAHKYASCSRNASQTAGTRCRGAGSLDAEGEVGEEKQEKGEAAVSSVTRLPAQLRERCVQQAPSKPPKKADFPMAYFAEALSAPRERVSMRKNKVLFFSSDTPSSSPAASHSRDRRKPPCLTPVFSPASPSASVSLSPFSRPSLWLSTPTASHGRVDSDPVEDTIDSGGIRTEEEVSRSSFDAPEKVANKPSAPSSSSSSASSPPPSSSSSAIQSPPASSSAPTPVSSVGESLSSLSNPQSSFTGSPSEPSGCDALQERPYDESFPSHSRSFASSGPPSLLSSISQVSGEAQELDATSCRRSQGMSNPSLLRSNLAPSHATACSSLPFASSSASGFDSAGLQSWGQKTPAEGDPGSRSTRLDTEPVAPLVASPPVYGQSVVPPALCPPLVSPFPSSAPLSTSVSSQSSSSSLQRSFNWPPSCMDLTRRVLAATLHNLHLRQAAAAPFLADENEWIATQLANCLADLQLLLTCVWDACTCPVMAAGSIFFLVLKSAPAGVSPLAGSQVGQRASSFSLHQDPGTGLLSAAASEDAFVTRELSRLPLAHEAHLRETNLRTPGTRRVRERRRSLCGGEACSWACRMREEAGEQSKRRLEHEGRAQARRVEKDLTCALTSSCIKARDILHRHHNAGAPRAVSPTPRREDTEEGTDAFIPSLKLGWGMRLERARRYGPRAEHGAERGATCRGSAGSAGARGSSRSRPVRLQTARQYMETVLAWCVDQVHRGQLFRDPPKKSRETRPAWFEAHEEARRPWEREEAKADSAETRGSELAPDGAQKVAAGSLNQEEDGAPCAQAPDPEGRGVPGGRGEAGRQGAERRLETERKTYVLFPSSSVGLLFPRGQEQGRVAREQTEREAEHSSLRAVYSANRAGEQTDAEGKRFLDIARRMCRRVFRCYAHIYHYHLDLLCAHDVLAHVNRCFKFFLFFAHQFRLLTQTDTHPLRNLVSQLLVGDSPLAEASGHARITQLFPLPAASPLPPAGRSAPSSREGLAPSHTLSRFPPPASSSFFLNDPLTELHETYKGAVKGHIRCANDDGGSRSEDDASTQLASPARAQEHAARRPGEFRAAYEKEALQGLTAGAPQEPTPPDGLNPSRLPSVASRSPSVSMASALLPSSSSSQFPSPHSPFAASSSPPSPAWSESSSPGVDRRRQAADLSFPLASRSFAVLPAPGSEDAVHASVATSSSFPFACSSAYLLSPLHSRAASQSSSQSPPTEGLSFQLAPLQEEPHSEPSEKRSASPGGGGAASAASSHQTCCPPPFSRVVRAPAPGRTADRGDASAEEKSAASNRQAVANGLQQGRGSASTECQEGEEPLQSEESADAAERDSEKGLSKREPEEEGEEAGPPGRTEGKAVPDRGQGGRAAQTRSAEQDPVALEEMPERGNPREETSAASDSEDEEVGTPERVLMMALKRDICEMKQQQCVDHALSLRQDLAGFDEHGSPDTCTCGLRRIESFEELPLLLGHEDAAEGEGRKENAEPWERRRPTGAEEAERREEETSREDNEAQRDGSAQRWGENQAIIAANARETNAQDAPLMPQERVGGRPVQEDLLAPHEKENSRSGTEKPEARKKRRPVLSPLPFKDEDFDEIRTALKEAEALKPQTPFSEAEQGRRRATKKLLESLLLQQQPYL
ncbi:hypothetical protein BESB_074210 [Besnoitia besnoiti]|uniref:Mob1/phocein family protein n=1 Tax=Besnoitia besnoiti TaxID=94643 RepID=A0A2A9M8M9_BESBE|nr:uncharacterized protein BESB_074210 [Besnoitia besnoiti]PFH34269.1 hypothetical protein BESB_074210 [Besnoitia besnoiti]